MAAALVAVATFLGNNRELHALRFRGIQRLYGEEGLARLVRAHVMVLGVGGVGGWSVEALARSGVGHMTIVDLDEVCISNVNRQLPALTSTVGRSKVEVIASRIAEINPEARVHAVQDFCTPATVDQILDARTPVDGVIDAVDGVVDKVAIIAACRQKQIPVVTMGAAGGKKDPGLVYSCDLVHAKGDPLLRNVRRLLRRDYGYPPLAGRGREKPWGVTCVSSGEETARAGDARATCDNFGTVTHVTAVFGMMGAGILTNSLAGE